MPLIGHTAFSYIKTISITAKENTSLPIAYIKSSYNSGEPVKVFVSKNMPTIGNSSNVITAVQNSKYQKTKQRLLEIDDVNCEEDEDDWGVTRPTTFAWQKSLKCLEEIEKYMQSNFPLGFANLASNGGIDLIWKNHKKENEVIVFIPSKEDENISLYIGDLSDGKSKLWINPSIQLLVIVLQFLYQ